MTANQIANLLELHPHSEQKLIPLIIERINDLAIPAEVKEEATGKLLLVLNAVGQHQD